MARARTARVDTYLTLVGFNKHQKTAVLHRVLLHSLFTFASLYKVPMVIANDCAHLDSEYSRKDASPLVLTIVFNENIRPVLSVNLVHNVVVSRCVVVPKLNEWPNEFINPYRINTSPSRSSMWVLFLHASTKPLFTA